MNFHEKPYLQFKTDMALERAKEIALTFLTPKVRSAIELARTIENEHYDSVGGEGDFATDELVLESRLSASVPDYVHYLSLLDEKALELLQAGHDGCNTPIIVIPGMWGNSDNFPEDLMPA